MAQKIIDIVGEDGNYIGDKPKIAYDKTNQNFTEIYKILSNAIGSGYIIYVPNDAAGILNSDGAGNLSFVAGGGFGFTVFNLN